MSHTLKLGLFAYVAFSFCLTTSLPCEGAGPVHLPCENIDKRAETALGALQVCLDKAALEPSEENRSDNVCKTANQQLADALAHLKACRNPAPTPVKDSTK